MYCIGNIKIIGAGHLWIVHSWQSRRIDNGEYLIFHECNNLLVKSMKAHNYFNKRYVFLVVSLQQHKLSVSRMNTVNQITKWKKKPNVYQFLENVTLINHCLDVTRMRFFLWFFHTIFQGSWFLFPFSCVYPEHIVGFGRGWFINK